MHGNKKYNRRTYHLYQIWDKEEKEVFKYGISSDRISKKDQLSKRIRTQVSLFNRIVGFVRFVGTILLRGISGRKKAEDIEGDYIRRYEEEHGKRPRGNP
jgi:hypothetical protein